MKNVLYQNFFCFASFCSVYLMVSIWVVSVFADAKEVINTEKIRLQWFYKTNLIGKYFKWADILITPEMLGKIVGFIL